MHTFELQLKIKPIALHTYRLLLKFPSSQLIKLQAARQCAMHFNQHTFQHAANFNYSLESLGQRQRARDKYLCCNNYLIAN